MQFYYYNIRRWVRHEKCYPKVNSDQSKCPPVQQERKKEKISIKWCFIIQSIIFFQHTLFYHMSPKYSKHEIYMCFRFNQHSSLLTYVNRSSVPNAIRQQNTSNYALKRSLLSTKREGIHLREKCHFSQSWQHFKEETWLRIQKTWIQPYSNKYNYKLQRKCSSTTLTMDLKIIKK